MGAVKPMPMNTLRTTPLLTGLIALLGLLAWSGWQPHDRTTWLLEIFPILLVLPLLVATHRRFPLTSLLYACIFVHACVLMLGGAYTYARVPLGFWIESVFDLQRNPYDKIGHLFQGFVPALAAREILIRGGHVHGRKMLNFIVVCIVMAVSASYELIEWAAALALGQGADEFLGTQGDPWDTQSDMFMALLGAVAALLLLSRWQDGQMSRARTTRDGASGTAHPRSPCG
jgi:putative membrane protein